MSENNYNTFSRVLHKFALNNSFIPEASFDLEKMIYLKPEPKVSQGNHVFVAGLARAGTTFLMRQIYEGDQFGSLVYRDMPFVLAPNLWKQATLISNKKETIQERAHKDGVMVSFNSPEALEEVFWSTFCSDQYIQDSALIPMSADDQVIDNYRDYIHLILKSSGKARYLSKNNNNILRLNSIAQAFPHATILVPFRNPIDQASSLLNQHLHFLKEHKHFDFHKKYMSWLVHHEFGADHRPFIVNGERSNLDSLDIDYWVQQWINVYTYLLESTPEQAVFVCYEKLSDNKNNIWNKLVDRLHLSEDIIPQGGWDKNHKLDNELNVSPKLSGEALAIYKSLVDISLG